MKTPMNRLAMLTVVVLGLSVLAPVLPQTAEAQGPKVTIIHKGRTISVAESAVPAHLAHGDRLADTCPDGEVPPCT